MSKISKYLKSAIVATILAIGLVLTPAIITRLSADVRSESNPVWVPLWAYGQVSKEKIRQDLLSAIQHNKKRWTSGNVSRVTDVLYFVHHSKDFRIDYRLLIAVFSHESWMGPEQKGLYSADYGLGQHNIKYLNTRFGKAIALNRKYRITSMKFNWRDPATSAFASAVYFRTLRWQIYQSRNLYPFMLNDSSYLILAYNKGYGGMVYRRNHAKTHPYTMAIKQEYATLFL